jgi:hypothetical protein
MVVVSRIGMMVAAPQFGGPTSGMMVAEMMVEMMAEAV